MTQMELYQLLKKELPESVLAIREEPYDSYLLVVPDRISAVFSMVKADERFGFGRMSFMSGIDSAEGFSIIYYLFSYSGEDRFILKAELPRENLRIQSASPFWKTAEWHECEIYDMFGIIFDGHPHLSRILCPEDWEGHALRKDYRQPEMYNELRVSFPGERADEK